MGFRKTNDLPYYPYFGVSKDVFYIQMSNNVRTEKALLPAYKNKQLFLWFTKNGDDYELRLCKNGGIITETMSSSSRPSFSINELNVSLYLKTQRVGFSPNYYADGGKEFRKTLFIEKSKGTYLG